MRIRIAQALYWSMVIIGGGIPFLIGYSAISVINDGYAVACDHLVPGVGCRGIGEGTYIFALYVLFSSVTIAVLTARGLKKIEKAEGR